MPVGPAVSVILPTYNRATLLPRAMRSVLEQDFVDLELLVVDDGSSDDTSQVVTEFNDRRIRYLPLGLNRGVGYARYTGLEAAHGDFIAMMDSDDVWTPGKLSTQMKGFECFPDVQLTFGDYWNTNLVTGERALGFTQNQSGLDVLKVSLLSKELDFWGIQSGLPQAMLVNNFVACPTLMFSKEIIRRVGNFDLKLKAAEDFEFVWRCAVLGVPAGYFRKPMMVRYKDALSTTAALSRFLPVADQALGVCAQTALDRQHSDLLPFIQGARHRLWRSLVHEFAMLGERRQSIRCFLRSLKYGVSGETFMFLLAGLAGRKSIEVARRLRRKWARA